MNVSAFEFGRAYSQYVDGFMAKRSVLASSLFPDKPDLMWLGYRYSEETLPGVTDWLRARCDPTALGRGLRRTAAPANGLNLASVVWSHLFGRLGYELGDGTPLHPPASDQDLNFLEFWRQVHVGYRNRPLPFDQDATHMPELRVLDAPLVADLRSAIHAVAAGEGAKVQKALATFTNFAWLLECESRQAVFNHGPYPSGSGRLLLVREFADLAGSDYCWMSDIATDVPGGRIAVVLELADAQVAFDLFGVVKLTPELYGECLTGVAVITPEGTVSDPLNWLAKKAAAVATCHGSLFQRVAGWSRSDRLYAASLSYAKVWAALAVAGGGGPEEVKRLIFDPLALTMNLWQAPHDVRTQQPAIWNWVGSRGTETIFAPVLARINPEQE